MSAVAREEWARALRCLESAQVLIRAADPDSAASRCYYAAYHAVTAFFLLEDREFGKHEAVESAVHRDLVRAGRVEREFGTWYSRLRELRMIGDYGIGTHVSVQDALAAHAMARSLLDVLRRLSGGSLI